MTLRHAWLAVTLALSAGCADLIEVQYDLLGDRRPSTMVQQLRDQLEGLKDAYRRERRAVTGPSTSTSGSWPRPPTHGRARAGRGRLGTHVRKAQEATATLDPLFARARISLDVHGRWEPSATRSATS